MSWDFFIVEWVIYVGDGCCCKDYVKVVECWFYVKVIWKVLFVNGNC